VFLPREYTDESPEHHLEAFLRFQRGQIPNRRLLADDELELRDEIDDERAVRAQRLLKALLPSESFSSLSPNIGRTRFRKACARVAYGMSRLYWSNLPEANRPRGGTSTLCSSFTTEDLPMPEYPDTSTSSAMPWATTRS